MQRGIYLVANRRSEREAANLLYSLRQAGCTLPVALIPFDDDLPTHPRLLAETTFLKVEDFPPEGRALLAQIGELWPKSHPGLFRRLLAWYGPFDEFIYSDNDIVALADWSAFLDYLGDYDLIHADQEYVTGGRYAYLKPDAVLKKFGPKALDSLYTTGHFASRKKPEIAAALTATVAWLRENPGVAREVDGPFLHLAVLVGSLRIKNMCQPPDNWPSPWAGDYRNALALVHALQRGGRIFQLHYAGWNPDGYRAIEELAFSDHSDFERMRRYAFTALRHFSGVHYVNWKFQARLGRYHQAILQWFKQTDT